MNTARRRALALVQLLALVAVPALGLVGCGEDDAPFDPATSAGVRRYGAPAPGTIDYGEGSKALSIGEAAAAPVKAKPETNKPRVNRPRRPNRPSGVGRVKAKPGKYAVAPVKNGGTVTGTVTFTSAPPARMVEFNKDQAACGHKEQPTQRMVFDPKTFTVANCFVYLADITKGKDWTGEFAKGPDDRVALLDQKDCTYVPHILAVRTDTQVQIKNSDPAEHNVHLYRGSASGPTQANVLSPAGSDLTPSAAYLEKATVYEVKCDIHAWMNGYIWAMRHPYFAVTDKDGKFVLKDVPPGTYTLVMWHEGMSESAQYAGGAISGYDYGSPVESTQKVTVDAGGTATCDFSIDPPSKK